MTKQAKYAAAVAHYLDGAANRNLTAATLRNYKAALRGLGRFLESRPASPEDVTFGDIEAWRDAMTAAGNKPSTIARRLGDAKIFFASAEGRAFPEALRFQENPVDPGFSPKVVKNPYDGILKDEQVALLYQNRPPKKQLRRSWPRNYAFVQLGLNEKLRTAEIRSLTLRDIDLEAKEVVVREGKGRKFRVVDLSELTETAIRLYLASGLRPASCTEDDLLFGASGKGAWSKWGKSRAYESIRSTVRAVTGVDGVGPHDLRHIGARLALNTGDSLEQIQADLGHSSVNTTHIYAGRLQQRKARAAAAQCLAERDRQAAANWKTLAELGLASGTARPQEREQETAVFGVSGEELVVVNTLDFLSLVAGAK